MPDPAKPATTQQLVLDEAPILKEPRDLSRHLMTKAEATAYQAGDLQVENENPAVSHLKPATGADAPVPQGIQPAPAPAPAQFVPQPQPVPIAQPQQVPAGPAPAVVSQQPLPEQQPAGAPIQPGDSQRVQTRIHRLYGQMRTAQEERDAYAERIAQLEGQVQALTTQAQQPEYRLDSAAPGVPSQQPAGDYVSRGELNQMLGQMTQAIARGNALVTSQNASRTVVESEFAQELADPQFRQTYESVLQQDASLANDPHGPEKAALMARGLLAGFAQPTPATGAVADAARRQALTPAVGPSVPEGSSPPASDRVTRYNQAMARAAATGKDEDFVRALQIQRGEA